VAGGTEASRRSPGRHIPNAVKRAVWQRDGGQCAFVVGRTGRRCSERIFLEFHHIHPHALDGPATVENISLRCRRHNQYEAELIFGPRDPSTVSEARESYSSGPPMTR
jgi:5-methylcytosine-specific restriction endonuclease McrA